MKKSKDWVRQEDLDAKLDAFVEPIGGIPPDMTICEVAERLGVTPSGEFYKKFRDWKRRHEANADLPAMGVPSDYMAHLRGVLDRMVDDVMATFAATARSVAGDIGRTAELRVSDAERRAAKAETEVEEVLDQWSETERKLAGALARAAIAEEIVCKLRRELDHLSGRLEERDSLLQTLRPRAASGENPAAPKDRVAPEVQETLPERPSRDNSEPADGATGRASERENGIDAVEPNAARSRGREQSSISEADGPQAQQAELSLVRTDNAGTAGAKHDDND